MNIEFIDIVFPWFGKVNYESNFNEKFIEISENLGIISIQQLICLNTLFYPVIMILNPYLLDNYWF